MDPFSESIINMIINSGIKGSDSKKSEIENSNIVSKHDPLYRPNYQRQISSNLEPALRKIKFGYAGNTEKKENIHTAADEKSYTLYVYDDKIGNNHTISGSKEEILKYLTDN